MIRLRPEDLVSAIGCNMATAEEWTDPLSGAAILHNINTLARLTHWLATIAHESDGLTKFEEDLRYSAKRLTEVWPSRFRLADQFDDSGVDIFADGMRNAAAYSYNPEKLANYVYDDANRMPEFRLGNTEPGDGWRHRGLGPIQITGRANQTACGIAIEVDLANYPDMLLLVPVGARSAGWFWENKGLNKLADENRFEDIVRRVSGARTGYDDRAERLQVVQSALEKYA